LIYSYFKLLEKFTSQWVLFAYFLAFIASFLEGAGMMLLLPLVNRFTSNKDTGTPDFGHLNEYFTFLNNASLITLILIIFSVFVLKNLVLFFVKTFTAYLQSAMVQNIRQSLYRQFLFSRSSNESNVGRYVNLLGEQTTKSQMAFRAAMALSVNVFTSIALFVSLLLISFEFALISIIFGSIFYFFIKTLNKLVLNWARGGVKISGKLMSLVIEIIKGHKYIVATGQVKPFIRRLDDHVKSLKSFQFRVGIGEAYTQSIREPLAIFAVCILALSNVNLQLVNDSLLVVALLLMYRLLNSLTGVQGNYQILIGNIPGLEQVDNLVGSSYKREDAKRNENEVMGSYFQGKRRDLNIEFKDLSYKYEEFSENLFNKINFKLNFGDLLVVVGPSGVGKTTLVDLLMGLKVPTKGKILVNGQNIQEKLNTWNLQIGYVPQRPIIFEGSICYNITGHEVEDLKALDIKELLRAATSAGLIEKRFTNITSLGDKLEVDGGNLSGGQSQRLAIARELYRNPKLLVLDEPTSALDIQTKLKVCETIYRIKKTTTVVVITHDPLSFPKFDKKLNLPNGKITYN